MSRRTPIISLVCALALIIGGWLLLGGGDEPTPGSGGERRGAESPAPSGEGTIPEFGDPDAEGGATPTVPEGEPLMQALGQVIDQLSGRGIHDATVTVTENGDPRLPPLGHCRTAKTGVFVHDFPERDSFHLTVRAEGYTSARWQVSDGITPEGIPLELANLELPIAPESVLWIQTEIDGLAPDDRLLVEVQLRQPRTPAEMGTPVFDKGSFTITGPETRVGGLPSGKYLLNFRTLRQRLGTREIELGMGEDQLVEFRLGPSLPIDGVVKHNGRPVQGGRLLIWGRDDHSNTTAMIDERGRYSVNLPAAGRYSFTFNPTPGVETDGNGGSTDIDVEIGGIQDLDFLSSHLIGRVVGASGEPIPRLSGTIFGPHALSFTTDDFGTFEFLDVPHGTYRWLFPQAPEGSLGATREFVLAGDTTIEYRFERSTELEVLVSYDPLPEEGQDLGREQVVLIGESGVPTPLRPGARPRHYEWPVEGGLGAVLRSGWAPWFFELPPTDLPPAQRALLVPGGDLTVTLVSRAGRAAGGTPFRIIPLDAPTIPNAWAERRTGQGGSTRLTLSPGTYRIEAEIDGAPVSREIEVHPRTRTEARLP